MHLTDFCVCFPFSCPWIHYNMVLLLLDVEMLYPSLGRKMDSPPNEGLFCRCVCVCILFDWVTDRCREFLTHLWLMRGGRIHRQTVPFLMRSGLLHGINNEHIYMN